MWNRRRAPKKQDLQEIVCILLVYVALSKSVNQCINNVPFKIDNIKKEQGGEKKYKSHLTNPEGLIFGSRGFTESSPMYNFVTLAAMLLVENTHGVTKFNPLFCTSLPNSDRFKGVLNPREVPCCLDCASI